MNITVNSQALAIELRLLNKVVPSKPAIHILSHVLFEAGGSGLEAYATDLELGLSTRCDAEVHSPGRMAIPAARLLALVEQFPDGDVSIALEDVSKGRSVSIKCGNFNSKLQALSADDFPKPPAVEGQNCRLDAAGLRELIAQTRYAINATSQKSILQGALLSIEGPVAVMVGTDTKRVALATMACDGNEVKVRVIVPAKTLDALATQPADDEMLMTVGPKHLFFQSGDRTLTSRMLEGVFPDYAKVVPRGNDKMIDVNRSVLAAALRRVKLVCEDTLAVKFIVEGKTLRLMASSAEVGAAEETVPIEYDGPDVKVMTSGQHVLDFLNAARNGNVTLALKDAKTAILATDGTDHLGVIILMK